VCELCGRGPAAHFKFGAPERYGWVTVFDGFLCRRCADETYRRFQGSTGVRRVLRGLLSGSPNVVGYHMGLAQLDAKEATDEP
jgi:hypothetical protein